jgi:calcium/calmodulin-dependent protein kinase I
MAIEASKVDVFSIGAVLYTLLCGSPPFRASDLVTTLELNRACEVKFTAVEWRSISYRATDFVAKLMHPSPEKRPTAEQALQDPFFTQPEIEFARPEIPKKVVVIS